MDVHTKLIVALEDWLKHYTNEQILKEALDKHLPIDCISDKELIKDDDIQLAIKFLRKLI
jgi:hypothetical protein